MKNTLFFCQLLRGDLSQINALSICYEFIKRRVMGKLQRAHTCRWMVWQLKIFLIALLACLISRTEHLFPYPSPRLYLIQIHILHFKTLKLVVLGKDACRLFLSRSWTRNVASVKGYDDHSNVSRFKFVFPAVFMKEKKNQNNKETNQNQNQPQHMLVSFWIYRLAQT